MTELTKGGPSRRGLLAGGLALPLAPALLRQAWAQGQATTTVHGFETGATSRPPRRRARSSSTRTTAILRRRR